MPEPAKQQLAISQQFAAARKKRRLLDNLRAWGYISPATILFLIFTFVPMFFALYVSLHRWNLLKPMQWYGVGHYLDALSNSDFWNSLWVTAYYVLGSVPIKICFAILIASILNQKMRSIGFYRLMIFLPVITSFVAVSIVWKYFYNPQSGLFNYVLGLFALGPIKWLQDPNWSMPSLILLAVWKGIGYDIVIFLAGLQAIPSMYYEAAAIDGANRWQRFRQVTLPLLSPVVFLVVILDIINAFQMFVPSFVLTRNGGPLQTTNVITLYIYNQAFSYLKMGYASAISYILFFIILVFTILNFKLGEKRVHYQS